MARAFGLPSATALVVANMIGAGLFTTSGLALADLGSRPLVLLAWVVGGAIAWTGAQSYARLARRIRESGGEYVFLSRTFHPALGFLAGWVSLFAGFTGAIAFAAQAFEAYALSSGTQPLGLPGGTLAIGSILVFTGLHAGAVRTGLHVQNAVVLLKLGLLAAFFVYAVGRGADPGWPGMGVADEGRAFALTSFAGSLVWISLSYSGFNAAVYVAGEVRTPERTVPRALVLGTLGVSLVYVALNTVFLYAPLPEAILGQQDVAARAADALGGPRIGALVRASIALALLSSVSSMIVAGPRVYAQMARDGLFPAFLAGRGEEAPPRSSILLQSALACLVVVLSDLEELLSYLGLTLSLCAAATAASLFWIRRREKARGALFVEVVCPAIYVLSTLVLAGLASLLHTRSFLATLFTLASGGAVYALQRRRRRAAPS